MRQQILVTQKEASIKKIAGGQINAPKKKEKDSTKVAGSNKDLNDDK
jgi:hypothetical protein